MIHMPDPMVPAIDVRLRFGGIGNRMNSEQPVHAADDAADYSADEASDRSRGLTADISAVRDAVGNALRLCRKRTSDRCCNGPRNQDV